MALDKNQVRAINKFQCFHKVVTPSGITWATDGKNLYKYDSTDVIEREPDKVHHFNVQKYQDNFGIVDSEETCFETGLVFDMLIEGLNTKVAVMTCLRGSKSSLVLVDVDKLSPVKQKNRSAENYWIGRREQKGDLIYNQDQTVAVVCIKDEMIPKVMKKYGDVFRALEVIYKFDAEFVE